MITVLPNGVEIPEEDLNIWKAYNYRCVAHPYVYAVCLHEEPPKSLNPNWRDMPDTRFPVCNECHHLVHSISRSDAGYYLETNRIRYFPDAVMRLSNGHS